MSDQAEIQRVVDTFFAAFTSGPGLDERMAALRAVMLERAVVTKAVGGTVELMDVEAFIEPRRALLAGGRVTAFREWETEGRTEVFQAIAQHWCRYAKSWREGADERHGAGAKTLQLVRTEQGWRIAAVAWDDDA